MKQIGRFFQKMNVRTLYFNFKYLPFNQAIKLPILLSSNLCLKKCSGQIYIDAPVKTGMIQIGFGDVGLFDKKKSRSIWEVSGIVRFKGECHIGHGSKISVGPKGKLIFGKNFLMTAESTIACFHHVEFGDNSLLSWDILIMDTDYHSIIDESGKVVNPDKPVIIGSKVWIGCRCLILKGTVIPNNCVIGANTTVTGTLEIENALYAGNPCKLLKQNITWKL